MFSNRGASPRRPPHLPAQGVDAHPGARRPPLGRRGLVQPGGSRARPWHPDLLPERTVMERTARAKEVSHGLLSHRREPDIDGSRMDAAIAARVVPGDPPDLYIVVPATPRPGAFTWNEDEATADAQGRLDAMLEHLKGLGLRATGEVGYRDPVRPLATPSAATRPTRSSCRPCRPGSRAGSARMSRAVSSPR